MATIFGYVVHTKNSVGGGVFIGILSLHGLSVDFVETQSPWQIVFQH